MPERGAYLGAWVNPGAAPKDAAKGQSDTADKEIPQLPAFNALVGTHVQILHVFSGFTVPLPAATLKQIEGDGAIPLLDWDATTSRPSSAARTTP
ncbi:MAG: hypothetical protein ACR2LX_03330 [Jatrophihabitans sp.]